MMAFTPARAETYEDRRRYLDLPFAEVGCHDCHAVVRVRKSSSAHTSIQWTAEAVRRCQELGRHERGGSGGAGVLESCPRLGSSIRRAVEEGRLPVGEAGPEASPGRSGEREDGRG